MASKYGARPGSPMDDVALLLNGFAKRCGECKKPTRNEFLDKSGLCPFCNGTDAQTPGNRSYGTNGGRECDTLSGPCSCGAWH